MSTVELNRSESPPSVSPAVTPVACFSVSSDVDPSALPRVLEVFALRDLVPTQVHVAQVGYGPPRDGESELAIDVQVSGLDAEAAEPIARKLRAIICVRSVETAQRRSLPPHLTEVS